MRGFLILFENFVI